MQAYKSSLSFYKTAWYSGREQLPLGLERRLGEYDFIKLGPYIEELGPLDNPNTNQKMYKVNKTYEEAGLYVLEDITNLFWERAAIRLLFFII